VANAVLLGGRQPAYGALKRLLGVNRARQPKLPADPSKRLPIAAQSQYLAIGHR
jgi:hypothetical protein